MHDSWGSELGLGEIHSLFEAPLNEDRFLARSQDERREGQGNAGSASEKGPHELEIRDSEAKVFIAICAVKSKSSPLPINSQLESPREASLKHM